MLGQLLWHRKVSFLLRTTKSQTTPTTDTVGKPGRMPEIQSCREKRRAALSNGCVEERKEKKEEGEFPRADPQDKQIIF